jgi:phytol kinase
MEDPRTQNLVAGAATVVYVLAVIAGCDWAVSRNVISSKVSRKIVHIMAGSWILFWPYFSTEHWTWRLNILVPFSKTLELAVKGLILRDPDDPDVRTLTRTGNPTELLFGPIYFTITMCWAGLYLFRQELALLIFACLGFGDGVAPLLGRYFPMGSYPTFPFGAKDRKTLSGSFGFAVASLLGYAIFASSGIVVEDTSSSGKNEIDWSRVMSVVAMATVTEGISGQFDNILIPLLICGLDFKGMI